MWIIASGFMLMRLVSRLSLTIYVTGPISGLTHGPSRSMCTSQPSQLLALRILGIGHLFPPIGLSSILSISLIIHIMGWCFLCLLGPPRFSRLVFQSALYSLLGCPIVRQLMQAVINLPGQGGQFQSTVSLHCYFCSGLKLLKEFFQNLFL